MAGEVDDKAAADAGRDAFIGRIAAARRKSRVPCWLTALLEKRPSRFGAGQRRQKLPFLPALAGLEFGEQAANLHWRCSGLQFRSGGSIITW